MFVFYHLHIILNATFTVDQNVLVTYCSRITNQLKFHNKVCLSEYKKNKIKTLSVRFLPFDLRSEFEKLPYNKKLPFLVENYIKMQSISISCYFNSVFNELIISFNKLNISDLIRLVPEFFIILNGNNFFHYSLKIDENKKIKINLYEEYLSEMLSRSGSCLFF